MTIDKSPASPSLWTSIEQLIAKLREKALDHRRHQGISCQIDNLWHAEDLEEWADTLAALQSQIPQQDETELVTATKAFLEKWPAVEKAVNGYIGLHFARTGVQYSGPNIGLELDLMRAAIAKAEPPPLPGSILPDPPELTKDDEDKR